MLPVVPAAVFLYSVWVTTKGRDIGAISIGELISTDFAEIDRQLAYLINGLRENMSQPELIRGVANAFSYTIGSLYKLLQMGIKDDSHLSVASTVNGTMTVIASEKVSATHAEKSHQEFRYGNDPKGVAGHAATRRSKIYIPDLEDEKDENSKLWIPLSDDEKKTGSLICVPIIRGLRGSGSNSPLGVLSITSRQCDAFGTTYKQQLIGLFAIKIELLLYILEMIQERNN